MKKTILITTIIIGLMVIATIGGIYLFTKERPRLTYDVCRTDDHCKEGQVCDTENYCEADPSCESGKVCPAVCWGRCVDQQTEPLSCAKKGESIGTCVGCITECCHGLKPMDALKINGVCVEIPPPGAGAVCSNCGNGICDKQNNEDECNCPEDCISVYYQELENKCRKMAEEGYDSANCCMASVEAMKAGNYILSPETGCPEGFQGNMLRCLDSFKWCEPIK